MILHFYIFVVSFLFRKTPPPTPQKKVPVDENAILLIMIWSDDIFRE